MDDHGGVMVERLEGGVVIVILVIEVIMINPFTPKLEKVHSPNH